MISFGSHMHVADWNSQSHRCLQNRLWVSGINGAENRVRIMRLVQIP